MHAILLTLLTLPGAGGPFAYGESYSPMTGEAMCDGALVGGHECGNAKLGHGGCLGPMPQSCYNPSYGCYPSTRFMHRYPAFHGSYYRQATNYRHYFDYPWHAGLHEPTSHFSYNVPPESAAPQSASQALPVPEPDTAARGRRSIRTASALAPVVRPSEMRR